MDIPRTPMRDKAHEWFVNYCRIIEEDVNAKKEIISTPNYMEWFYQVLDANGFVEYSPEGDESATKNFKVDKRLKTLFNLIRDYANQNYVISNLDKDGTSYYVSYNDIIFKIGFTTGDNGIIFIARRMPNQADIMPIIPFTAVREGIHLLSEATECKKELVELSNYITAIKKSGITDEEIVYTTGKALKYVR